METKLLYRLMKQQKMSLLLNVTGLSVAFAVLFITAKQVGYDFSYDKCYPEAENIYRLDNYDVLAGRQNAYISMPLAREIMAPVPEVEAYTILWTQINQHATFYNGDREYPETPLYGVTPGFFEIFQPQIIAGNAIEAIKNKSGVVIPQSMAKKWFGNENPIGKAVGWGAKDNRWTIKAVYEDFPENSSMRNAIIVQMNEDRNWGEWGYNCFFKVAKNTDLSLLEKKFVSIADSSYARKYGSKEHLSDHNILKLTPIKELYFNREASNTLQPRGNGNLALTLCLLTIGVLIVIVAYINFINFSTALAPSWIGTLNLCKIAGASSMELKKYIIGEAMLLSLIAWVFSFLGAWAFSATALAKEYFSTSLSPLDNIGHYLLLGGGSLILGMLAGLYPAYYTTSFRPALVLKSSFAMSGNGRRLRAGLLVFQFVVTISLTIASLFVVLQHHYLRNQPWGYQRENIVYTWTTEAIKRAPETFRSELMKNPNVTDVTTSGEIPGSVNNLWGKDYKDKYIQFYVWPVASNFLSFFGIPIYEGDTLRNPAPGSGYAILNRNMVEKFELQKEIGQKIVNNATVLGFAENVNFNSLYDKIGPLAFVCDTTQWNRYYFIKIRPANVPETMGYIKDCFAKYGEETSEVKFLDEYINSLYHQEESLSQLISLFCLITILISLVGIYGLILFNVRYKVKEISIRKINGAGSGQMLWMLNGIFVRLILIGFALSIPLAYYLVDGWLKEYPYRTPIHSWVFVVAFLITLLVTIITVSWQSWRAANANPIDAIKTE